MQEFSTSGLWWLPSNPEREVAGDLSFSYSDGIRLELLGTLEPNGDFGALGDHEAIFGVTRDGDQVTVVNSMGTGMRMTGIMTEEYSVRVVYWGAHIDQPSSFTFHRADAYCENVFDWARTSGFETTYTAPRGQPPQKFDYTYAFPEEATYRLENGELEIGHRFSQTGDLQREISLRQQSLLRVKLDQPIGLEEWQTEYLYPLQQLVTLFTSRPSSLKSLKIFSKNFTINVGSEGETRQTPIEITYWQIREPDVEGRKVRSDDLIATLPELQPYLPEGLQVWLNLSQSMRNVFGLLFSQMYRTPAFTEQRFLGLAHAAEIYHRRRFGRESPSKEHEARFDEIVNAVPDAHRDWLMGKLRYSHEPSLHERMTELMDHTYPLIKRLGGKESSVKWKIANTRNYYTHYDPGLKDQALEGQDLHFLCEALVLLLKACLLVEFGFVPEDAVERLLESRDARAVRGQI